MSDPIPGYVALAVLVFIMVPGAISKLRSLDGFEAAVAGYRLLPVPAIAPFGVVFAGAELVFGLLLAVPGLPRMVGAIGSGAVVGLATLAMVINLARGRTDIDCGCGGLSGESGGGLSWWLVARNAGLMVLAAVAGWTTGAPWRGVTGTDAVTLAGATLASLGLYLILTQLVMSHVRMRRDRA